jgi:hypothetical protein
MNRDVRELSFNSGERFRKDGLCDKGTTLVGPIEAVMHGVLTSDKS